MNGSPALAATAKSRAQRADFAVSGYWRSYYFGFYFAEKGAPGE